MDNLSTVDKLAGPNVSFIERFHQPVWNCCTQVFYSSYMYVCSTYTSMYMFMLWYRIVGNFYRTKFCRWLQKWKIVDKIFGGCWLTMQNENTIMPNSWILFLRMLSHTTKSAKILSYENFPLYGSIFVYYVSSLTLCFVMTFAVFAALWRVQRAGGEDVAFGDLHCISLVEGMWYMSVYLCVLCVC